MELFLSLAVAAAHAESSAHSTAIQSSFICERLIRQTVPLSTASATDARWKKVKWIIHNCYEWLEVEESREMAWMR